MNKLLQGVFVNALKVHQTVYELTGGFVGHHMPLMPPSMLLHTIGRRTGEPRTVALTYAKDGANYLITASNGGARRPPAWLLNINARPQCEIQVGRDKLWVVARPVVPGNDEYGRLWDLVNKVNGNRYRAYQKKTDRPIAVVVLTPVQ